MQKWQLPHGSHTSWASGWTLKIITAAPLSSPARKVRLKMILGFSQPGSLVRNSVFDFFTGDSAFWIWGKAKLHPVSGTLQTKSLKKVNYLRSMKIVLCALQFPASSRSVLGRSKLPTWKALEPVTSGADNITKNSFASSFLSVFLHGTPIHINFANNSYRSMWHNMIIEIGGICLE